MLNPSFKDPDFDKLAESEATQWNKDDKPLPLRRKQSEPQPFPMEALGPIISPAAMRLQQITQAPAALCAQSSLAAATLAVQAYGNVSIDGRTYPLSNNFITIAESGERKSATDRAVLAAARRYQEILQRAYDSEKAAFDIEHATHERAKQHILARRADKKEHMAEKIRQLGTAPIEPLYPFVIVEEPTYEGLFKTFLKGQPAMGLFSDEGGRLVGGHGMSQEQLLKTLTGLSELWDGKETISRIRAEDGASSISGKRLSLHLMIQPIVAANVFANPIFAGQGFLPRCLICWPKSNIGERPYREDDISRDPKIMAFHEKLLDIHRSPKPLKEGKANELNLPSLHLSAPAKKAWVEFHDYVEASLGDGGEYFQIKSFGSKAAEHALRVAGVLTLLEDIRNREIPVQNVIHAIALINFYLNEYLRVVQDSAGSPDIASAEALLSWLQKQTSRTFHLAQIYQFGPSQIREAKLARKILAILNGHGWIQPAASQIIDGQKRKEVWELREF